MDLPEEEGVSYMSVTREGEALCEGEMAIVVALPEDSSEYGGIFER